MPVAEKGSAQLECRAKLLNNTKKYTFNFERYYTFNFRKFSMGQTKSIFFCIWENNNKIIFTAILQKMFNKNVTMFTFLFVLPCVLSTNACKL